MVYAKMDHVAINVNNFEENVRFFKEVFEMEIEKTAGESVIKRNFYLLLCKRW